jgi:hypothetical protein
MTRSRRLQVEHLEDRMLPTTFGLPWPDASRLSLSFAPDGTPVDGQTSALFSTLSALPEDVWKTEILRAFQTWAINGNINIGLVADGGQAFGVTGAVEGDSRFGDIRIGASSLPVHLAMNSPFSVLNATRAGDVLLNSGVAFGIGDSGGYDLYSIMLNEAGNVFGIADNWWDPSSAMYEYYNGVRTGLTADDIAALQALYGARDADAYEGALGNNTRLTATALSFNNDVSRVTADVTTVNDVDFYSFSTSNGQFSVSLQTAGHSLLVGRLSVYDSFGTLLGSVSSSTPLQENLSLAIQTLTSSATYYISVESGRQDVFGIGGYRLVTNVGTKLAAAEPANNDFTDGKVRDDHHSDDMQRDATNLDRSAYTTDSRFDYRVQGKLRDAVDVDYYKFSSPVVAPGSTHTLLITAYGVENNGLRPTLSLYDNLGNRLAAEVLVNDAGNYVLQLANAASDADYYVRVSHNPEAAASTGVYFLGIDFQSETISLSSAGTGTLDSTNLQDWRTLTNLEAQVFHFVLSSTDDELSNGAIRMRIYDSNNKVVFTLVSKNGEAVSGNIFLAAGEYTIRFEGGTKDGEPMPAMFYDLQAAVVTDALDPIQVDVTIVPIGMPKPPTFAWSQYDDTYYSFLEEIDPYGNPWTGF